MQTRFEYKLNGKTYKCDFGFQFVANICDAFNTDLDDIDDVSKKVFKIDTKKAKNEELSVKTVNLISVGYKLLFYGIITNDELDGNAKSISLRDCSKMVMGNLETLGQVYSDALNCTISFAADQDVTKMKDENDKPVKKEKKRVSQSGK